MGFQASRELGEGDMCLAVIRLLSPICSGSPRRGVGERCFTGVSYGRLATGARRLCASASFLDCEAGDCSSSFILRY